MQAFSIGGYSRHNQIQSGRLDAGHEERVAVGRRDDSGAATFNVMYCAPPSSTSVVHVKTGTASSVPSVDRRFRGWPTAVLASPDWFRNRMLFGLDRGSVIPAAPVGLGPLSE